MKLKKEAEGVHYSSFYIVHQEKSLAVECCLPALESEESLQQNISRKIQG